MNDKPYNPLDRENLAKSVEAEMLRRDPIPFSSVTSLVGAGVYAIYYAGNLPVYLPVRLPLDGSEPGTPIYVGKAIPQGGRTGRTTSLSGQGHALRSRLRNHYRSIDAANNLELVDFRIRVLVLDDIWIPLGENVLIEKYRPLWNSAISGFGSNTPGKGRPGQTKSYWDTLHPGRPAFSSLPDHYLGMDGTIERARKHLEGEIIVEAHSEDESSL